ncbi:hypothetical protein DV736_g5266, partial [Chaetothyriales sp. CBS 134916]
MTLYRPSLEVKATFNILKYSRNFTTSRALTKSDPQAIAEAFISKFASGQPFVRKQLIDANQLRLFSLTLNRPCLWRGSPTLQKLEPTKGTPVPPAYHWAYFNPVQLQFQLGIDGTDASFNPGPPFTRRMWAGGSLYWPGAKPFQKEQHYLTIGDITTETTRLLSCEPKIIKRTGESMLVVGISKELRDSKDHLCVVDNRSWVFREALDPSAPASVPKKPAEFSRVELDERDKGRAVREINRDEVQLFPIMLPTPSSSAEQLLELGQPFVEFPRFSFIELQKERDLEGSPVPFSQWLQRRLRAGQPFALSDFEKLDEWQPENSSIGDKLSFGIESLIELSTKKNIPIRNCTTGRDLSFTLRKFADNARQSFPEFQYLYARDLPCPKEWLERCQKLLPTELQWSGRLDLFQWLPPCARSEVMMAYVGSQGSSSGFHRCFSSTVALNFLVEADDHPVVCIGTDFDSQKKYDAFMTARGVSPHLDWHDLSSDEMLQADFPIYVYNQRVGDLVVFPPATAHQIWNPSTLTTKMINRDIQSPAFALDTEISSLESQIANLKKYDHEFIALGLDESRATLQKELGVLEERARVKRKEKGRVLMERLKREGFGSLAEVVAREVEVIGETIRRIPDRV